MLSTAELHVGWTTSGPKASVISRPLSSLEQMFALLNDKSFGQNCPYIGCTVSTRSTRPTANPFGFDASTLQQRAELAFQQTRWNYPMVACRVLNAKEMVYKVENIVEIQAWAKRTVHVVASSGGWLPLREKVSRDAQVPTVDGDCCSVYVIYSPEKPPADLRSIDILIHFHHSLVDGSGIRTILNEFIARLADPISKTEPTWGMEIERLYPACVELATEEAQRSIEVDFSPSQIGKDLRNMFAPDEGLPLYRPDILTPKREHRGSSLVAHTFDSPDFLAKILQKSRSQGAKLSAVLLAALFQVIYESADTKPESTSSYRAFTAVDIRNNGRMVEPYDQRNYYVFNAVSKQNIDIEVDLVQKASEKAGFWELVRSLSVQYAALGKKKGLAGTDNNTTKLLIDELLRLAVKQQGGPPSPQTSPFFVPDPPGSNQLDGTYKMSNDAETVLELDCYQMSTDQSGAKVSARSHSWKGKLTLCIVFNMIRIPRAEMEKLLSRWVKTIELIFT